MSHVNYNLVIILFFASLAFMTVRQFEIQAALIGGGVAGIIVRVVISALARKLFWRSNVYDANCQIEGLDLRGQGRHSRIARGLVSCTRERYQMRAEYVVQKIFPHYVLLLSGLDRRALNRDLVRTG